MKILSKVDFQKYDGDTQRTKQRRNIEWARM